MEQIVEIKKFLLETIWGILILGACGSVLGGFLVYLAKAVINLFAEHKNNIYRSFLYRYFKQVDLGEKFMQVNLHLRIRNTYDLPPGYRTPS